MFPHMFDYENFFPTKTPKKTRGLKKESDVDPMENTSFNVSLEIDEQVYKKIMYWVNKSNFEVSGLGKIAFDPKDNSMRVIDAVLIEQENGSISTEISAAAVGKAMFLLKDTPGDLRFWWHSHVNMEVFWSGTDMATIKQLAMGGWFVSTVFNKKNEMKSAYSQSSPVRLVLEDIPTEISLSAQEANPEWDREYEDKVTVKPDFDYSKWMLAPHSGAIDMYKDYSAELEDKLDKLWKKVQKGKISEKQFDNLAEKLEDQYILVENDLAEKTGDPKIERKSGKKASAAKEDEKEADDLETWIDENGELRLRKR